MFKNLLQLTLVVVLFTVPESVFAVERDINKEFKIDGGSLDVNINILAGELEIIPSGTKSELKVTAGYDDKYCDIKFDYNIRTNTVTIATDYEKSKNLDCHDRNDKGVKISVELPYNPEIDLDIESTAGNIDIQLGDLSLKNFDIKHVAGDLDLDFNKPNRITLGTFDIDCTAGNIDLKNLGNAHFGNVSINNNAGQLSVDFSGDILEDVNAYIDNNVGGMDITIPKKVGTKMEINQNTFLNPEKQYRSFEKKGSSYYSDNYDNSDTLLSLNVSAVLGNVDVRMK
ncbi:DUF4097 family beta strand repeat-containing protein [Candidatus Latescibacterota bacterium]